LKRDQFGGFHGFNHECADLLFFHFGSPENKLTGNITWMLPARLNK
jgi:hypothetical protein